MTGYVLCLEKLFVSWKIFQCAFSGAIGLQFGYKPHLQALDGADVEMTLEVQVKAPAGIDEQTARIVLENSAALKVENPGLY